MPNYKVRFTNAEFCEQHGVSAIGITAASMERVDEEVKKIIRSRGYDPMAADYLIERA